jgi:hypothetical protein
VIRFDFDSAVPQLRTGAMLPLVQSAGGLSAVFGGSGAYAVQNGASTLYSLPGFSGRYLVPTTLDPGPLVIKFSSGLQCVSLAFATADFDRQERPSLVRLEAFQDGTPVGAAEARASYGSGTMPTGSLTYFSGGAPFDTIVLSIPAKGAGTRACLVDDLAVTVF